MLPTCIIIPYSQTTAYFELMIKSQIVIIINEKIEKLVEATKIFQPKIVEFKVFQRNGVGLNVHAVQFEPIIPSPIEKPFIPITPISAPEVKKVRKITQQLQLLCSEFG